jgi:type VI secretion system protein VasJ
MNAEPSAVLNPWLMPIAGDAPAGRDARHEPEHESVRAEVQKLASLSGGKVDWKLVETVGTTLLASKSKDLLIAAYVAHAMFEQNALPGCMEGLALLTNLLTHFGDALHPLRSRARANAIEWYATNLVNRLQDRVPDSLSQAEAVRDLARAFLIAVADRLGEHAPSLSAVRAAADRLLLSAPQAAAASVDSVASPDSSSNDGSVQKAVRATLELDAQAPLPWLEPISADRPAGEDTSYVDEHVVLRDEIAKLENASAGQPDWSLIASGADTLLRTRSKDLNLACYYAIALAETQREAGLLLGLRVVEGILRIYWDALWPPLARIKRRAGAIEWLVARAPITVASWSGSDPTLLDQIKSANSALERQVCARFGASLPLLATLSEAIDKLAQKAAAIAPPPALANEVTQAPLVSPNELAPAVSAVTAPAVVSAPQSSAELSKFLEATGDALVDAGSRLRQEAGHNPRAYELTRTGVWLSIDAAPPADTHGVTRVPAPLARLRETLDGMVSRQEWSDLLTQSEGTLPRSPFWLDLQRYSSLALAGLGTSHSQAHQSLEREARAFVARLPTLLHCKFADGTPFASPDTARWLSASEVNASGRVEDSDAVLPDGMGQRLLCGEPAAIAEVNALLGSAGSGRRSFTLRLALATLLEATAHPETVTALYMSLERDIDAHRLVQWEPSLAIEAFAGLRRALRKEADARGGPSPELQRVCARLAQLTPGALL